MTQHSTALSPNDMTTTALERALEELDQVIHRSKAILQHARKPGVEERLQAWKSIRGLWKGKIVEDPVAYQRRIRDEEDV